MILRHYSREGVTTSRYRASLSPYIECERMSSLVGEMSSQLFDGSQDKGAVPFFALAREIGHPLIDLERDQPPLMMH